MTADDEKDLAEAVLATRTFGFGPALEVIKPVVQRIVARSEAREKGTNMMKRDYGRILIHLSTLGESRE